MTGSPAAGERLGPADRHYVLPWPDGRPPTFKPEQVQKASGGNVLLYRFVLTISMVIGSTDFEIEKPKANGEFDYVLRHQALETMKTTQPSEVGKSILAEMRLKIVTGMHPMLNGEMFWLLTRRLRQSAAWYELTPPVAIPRAAPRPPSPRHPLHHSPLADGPARGCGTSPRSTNSVTPEKTFRRCVRPIKGANRDWSGSPSCTGPGRCR